MIPPPDWLDRIGRAYWRQIAPVMRELGKLDDSTIELIAMACQAYSTYRHAVKTLDSEGRVITTHTGARKVNPNLQVEKQAFEQVVRVWRELQMQGKPPLVNEADELQTFIGVEQS